jgi:Fe-S-cluster containining protein
MRKLKVLPQMQCDEGCGDCCGLIPVNETEFRKVERYVKDHGIVPIEHHDGTCPLYQDGKCTVYPVRPLICQLFGHSEDKLMQCTRGYNVNIPEREVHRMIAANGGATRTLHDLLPDFEKNAEEWGRSQRAKSLVLADGGEPELDLRQLAQEMRDKP